MVCAFLTPLIPLPVAGVPVSLQQLVGAGRLLEGSVADCNIQRHSTLHMNMQLRGGNLGDMLATLILLVICLIAFFAGLGWYARRR